MPRESNVISANGESRRSARIVRRASLVTAGTAAIVCVAMYAGNLGVRIGSTPESCVYWTPFRLVELSRASAPGTGLNSIDQDAMLERRARCRLVKNRSPQTRP